MSVLSPTSYLVFRLRALLNDTQAFLNGDLVQLLMERSAVVSLQLMTSADKLTHRAAVDYLDEASVQVYAGVGLGGNFTPFTTLGYGSYDMQTFGIVPSEPVPDPSPADLSGSSLLVLTTDYTLDAARGIVTTTVAETRGMWLVGVTYDLYGAAADGWEQIALGRTAAIDYSSKEGTYKNSQTFTNPLAMADRFRKRAWPGVY